MGDGKIEAAGTGSTTPGYLFQYTDPSVTESTPTSLDQYRVLVPEVKYPTSVPQYKIENAAKLWASHHSFKKCKVNKELKALLPDIQINYTKPQNPNGANVPTVPNMFGLNTTTKVEEGGKLSDAAEIVFSYGNQLAEGFMARVRLADGRNIEFPALILEIDRNFSPGRIGEQLILISKRHLQNLGLSEPDITDFQAHMQANAIPVYLTDDPLFNVEISPIEGMPHRRQYTVHATIPEKIWEETPVTLNVTFNAIYPKPGHRGFLGWLASAFNSDNGNIGAHFQPAHGPQTESNRPLAGGANGTIRLDDIRLGPKTKKSIEFTVQGKPDAVLDPLSIPPFVNQPLAMVLAQRIAVWMDGEHLITQGDQPNEFRGIKTGNGITIGEEVLVREEEGERITTITSFPSPYFIELHEKRIDVPDQAKPAYSLTDYIVREIPPDADLSKARQVARVVFEFGSGDNQQGLPDPSYEYTVSGGPCVGSYKLYIGDEGDGRTKIFSHGLVTCSSYSETDEEGLNYVRTEFSLQALNTQPNSFKETSFYFIVPKEGQEEGYSQTRNTLNVEYVSPN
ncbi:hypothetical protein K1X76_04095 [bacterium]|nr:hypothetical protein [bacterium]